MTHTSAAFAGRRARTLLRPYVPVCLAALALAAGCHEKSVEHVETSAAVPVAVDVARLAPFGDKVVASGLVAAAPGAELTVIAPEGTRIAEIPRAEGETVKTGDLLVRFDLPNLTSDVAAKRAAVAQASARVEAAKASFTRLTGLLAQGVAAPREVEDAKRQQAEAEADLEQARTAVETAVALSARAVVRAAFPGVVAKRFHNAGDFVEAAASDPVLKVINPAQLQVVASVPVSDLRRVVVGRPAQVKEPGRDEGEAARVLTKPAWMDPASATGDVRLGFLKPTSLPAGTRVDVEIEGEAHPQALVIPAAAVVSEEGEIFVMVAGADNKAHKYPIAIGLSTRTEVEVTSGLKAGDRVIVRGQDGLPEGATISVEAK
jgi:RND family efflux transporter MFP subunit